MKYIFLSVNEDLSCGLLKTQFMDPIKNNFNHKYDIVSINRPFYKGKTDGVMSLNLLIPQSLLAYNVFCFFYLLWAMLCALLIKIRLCSSKERKLVARGYLSGLIAYYLKINFGIGYIFDPRSIYPLECITAGRMRKGSIPYRFWMSVESKIVRFSERTVCVSSGMEQYYSDNYDVDNTTIVPCYRTEHGGFDKNVNVQSIKNKLDLNNNKKTVLYFGSLNNGWNNIDLYIDFISNRFSEDVQFLIISQDRDRILLSKLGTLDNVHVQSLDTLPHDVTIEDVFHCSDYGMIFMSESYDWFTRLSVKFAEYTYFGLPVITNQWVGEAVRLIHDFEISPSKVIENEKIELVSPTIDNKLKISHWGADYFSPSNINKYVSD
ncbi:hypothetical protein LTQ03_05765 [Vibrio splendidus]|uniref:hypothetical protein n=1 Tax=Vibrio splendidus TaxID=29497 RepID=UPI001FB23710|nr:hypothetical protein [Vibrio splendidus]UOE80891.1 hypothetical protein LTQ03_05765 [Vibrio splendidus]